MTWVDTHLSKATVPILYGSLGSALKRRRVSQKSRSSASCPSGCTLGPVSLSWGIIARKRVKKDGRSPKKLWHDLLSEFTDAFDGQPFFGGEQSGFGGLCSLRLHAFDLPFPQFDQLQDHEAGMTWYEGMTGTLHGA